jgi:hypothetical protein
MEGFQIAAFAPLLAVILCASLGNCCMTRGLRTTILNLEQRVQTLESVRATPQVILTPPPQLPPLPQTYSQPAHPPSYYYPQQPYMNPTPSAPRTSSII